jgi:hypothetical protein
MRVTFGEECRSVTPDLWRFAPSAPGAGRNSARLLAARALQCDTVSDAPQSLETLPRYSVSLPARRNQCASPSRVSIASDVARAAPSARPTVQPGSRQHRRPCAGSMRSTTRREAPTTSAWRGCFPPTSPGGIGSGQDSTPAPARPHEGRAFGSAGSTRESPRTEKPMPTDRTTWVVEARGGEVVASGFRSWHAALRDPRAKWDAHLVSSEGKYLYVNELRWMAFEGGVGH